MTHLSERSWRRPPYFSERPRRRGTRIAYHRLARIRGDEDARRILRVQDQLFQIHRARADRSYLESLSDRLSLRGGVYHSVINWEQHPDLTERVAEVNGVKRMVRFNRAALDYDRMSMLRGLWDELDPFLGHPLFAPDPVEHPSVEH